MQWYLLRDSDGKKSVSYTMMVITFCVCTLWLSLSMFQKVFHLDVREFDASGASIWFAPIATLYFSRKWHQAKIDAETQLGVVLPPGGSSGKENESSAEEEETAKS